MAKEQKDESGEGVLVTAAKTIGKAVGKVASSVGVEGDAASPREDRRKNGKFPKAGKKRLPRKEKKRQQKAAAL